MTSEYMQDLENEMDFNEELHGNGKARKICPYCKNEKIQKVGKYATVKGKKQRYKCTECGRSFY